MGVRIEQRDARLGPPLDFLADGEEIRLLWTDPPFGTSKFQKGGSDGGSGYRDPAADEARDLCCDALKAWTPAVAADGVVCVLADYRISADIVVFMKRELGWIHEGDIVWTFGLGRARTSWWPVRHNTISVFVREPGAGRWTGEVPTERRLAPKKGYESAEKRAGSVWTRTMSNTDPERVGRANQKPLSIVEPFVLAHTDVGDLVADCFAGSGTVGAAALKLGRRALLVDSDAEAVQVMQTRLGWW